MMLTFNRNKGPVSPRKKFDKQRSSNIEFCILNIYELNTYLIALFMYSYYHSKLPTFYDNFFF